jgi:hypothetical protein
VNEKSDLFWLWKLVCVKRTKAHVDEVADDWANLAVEGHFTVKTMVGIGERLAYRQLAMVYYHKC